MKNNYEISDNLRNFISSNLELVNKDNLDELYSKAKVQLIAADYGMLSYILYESGINVFDALSMFPDYLFCFSPIKEVHIPNKFKHISRSAFRGCGVLEKVTLDRGIETINENAFNNCYLLEKINFPEGLVAIYNSAFLKCFMLEKVDFPESLKFLGRHAFDECSSIKKIYLPDFFEHLGRGCFAGCLSLKNISIPKGIFIDSFNCFPSNQEVNIDFRGNKEEWERVVNQTKEKTTPQNIKVTLH